jgi:hypothetical protein
VENPVKNPKVRQTEFIPRLDFARRMQRLERIRSTLLEPDFQQFLRHPEQVACGESNALHLNLSQKTEHAEREVPGVLSWRNKDDNSTTCCAQQTNTDNTICLGPSSQCTSLVRPFFTRLEDKLNEQFFPLTVARKTRIGSGWLRPSAFRRTACGKKRPPCRHTRACRRQWKVPQTCPFRGAHTQMA